MLSSLERVEEVLNVCKLGYESALPTYRMIRSADDPFALHRCNRQELTVHLLCADAVVYMFKKIIRPSHDASGTTLDMQDCGSHFYTSPSMIGITDEFTDVASCTSNFSSYKPRLQYAIC